MTAVLNKEANITKLVASTVEAALLLLLPLGELASDPDAVELGAPAIPEPELDGRVGVAGDGEVVSIDAEVAGADGAAPVPPARVES